MYKSPSAALRAAIMEIKKLCDAESYGYGDVYEDLLAYYHAHFDPSWMPQGYGCSRRDPSIPLVVDMSNIPLLTEDATTFGEFVRRLPTSKW